MVAPNKSAHFGMKLCGMIIFYIGHFNEKRLFTAKNNYIILLNYESGFFYFSFEFHFLIPNFMEEIHIINVDFIISWCDSWMALLKIWNCVF